MTVSLLAILPCCLSAVPHSAFVTWRVYNCTLQSGTGLPNTLHLPSGLRVSDTANLKHTLRDFYCWLAKHFSICKLLYYVTSKQLLFEMTQLHQVRPHSCTLYPGINTDSPSVVNKSRRQMSHFRRMNHPLWLVSSCH